MAKELKVSEEQHAVLEKIADVIASKQMTTPVIFFLETVQPLNYMTSQVMAYLEPFLTFVIPRDGYNDVQKLLEHREGINYFLTVLEEAEYQKTLEDEKAKRYIKGLKELKKISAKEKKSFLKRLKDRISGSKD